MSDEMLLAALRVPIKNDGPLSDTGQLVFRARQAANRIEADAKQIKDLLAERDALRAEHAAPPLAKPAEQDPCPGCTKGGVCRTPKCGRLKLPVDHPFRTTPRPKLEPLTDAQIEAISGPWAWENLNCSEHLIAFARAIERAHGICKASE